MKMEDALKLAVEIAKERGWHQPEQIQVLVNELWPIFNLPDDTRDRLAQERIGHIVDDLKQQMKREPTLEEIRSSIREHIRKGIV
jgi:hypothetical protein